MLILHPQEVKFGETLWRGVTTVVVDAQASSRVVEWGDEGPHPRFADVPERITTIRVMMELTNDTFSAPALGSQDLLTLYTAPTGANTGRTRVQASAVVVGVTHEVSPRKGAVRTVELVAISSGGVSDPVTVDDAGGVT